MRTFINVLLALASVSACLGSDPETFHGYKSSRGHLPRVPIPGAVSADTLVADEDLPKSFDWRYVNGQNYVVSDWNQHIPQYCGACWIHGTLSPLNDRIKVMRRGQFPDVILGRQSVMNCVPPSDGKGGPPGCNGGDAWMIHKYMMETKVPDETCMPYQAKNMGCQEDTICRNCLPVKPNGSLCFPIKSFTGYGVSSYGNLSGEPAMMKEIFARGPIACSFATNARFMKNYSDVAMLNEGVYVTDETFTKDQIDHVMEVAGWGETPSGMKYWVIRNSWGTFWGDSGWLKLKRGENMLLSESECDWAVPTWDDLDDVLEGKVLGSYMNGVFMVEDPSLMPVLAAPAKLTLAAERQGDSLRTGRNRARAALLAAAFLLGAGVVLAVFAAVGRRRLWQPPLLG